MNKPFKNRRVLLTGAAGGIGSAIARYFLEAGAVVAGSDSQNGMLAALQETLGSAGNNFVPVAADLTISGALGDLVDRSWALLGGLDTLVNCAAVYPVHPILQMSESDWDRVIAINLKAPFFLSQAFARRLVEASRPGHIVNISSGNAERARAGAAHYSASKAGLEMLTRTYALEFAKHRIHVNSVSPGFIDVQSSVSPLSPAYVEAISSTIPWPRLGQPDDIAKAVGFLCSDHADWITGITLRVDGGRATGNTTLPLAYASERS